MAEFIEVPQVAIMQALYAAINLLIAKYDDLGMRASGDWARELEPGVEGNKGFIMGLDYTQYMVKGSKPAKPPKKEIILKWMDQKGTFDYENDEEKTSIAIAISKAISKDGTKAYQKGGTDLLEVLNSQEVVAIFNDQIRIALIPIITESLRREFKQLEINK